MKQLRVLTGVVVAAAMLLTPATVAAVTYGGIGARPANPNPNNPRTQSIFVYQLNPGQQISDAVQIVNNTNQRQTIGVYAVDSVIASGGTFTCAQQGVASHDVGSWIKLQTSSVTLAANTNTVVPFTITVPAHVDVGEHDGCIAVQAESQSNSTKSGGVVLSYRSALRVAITIPGTIVKHLTISNVTVTHDSNNQYIANVTVKNDGNVSLDTAVSVSLVSLLGFHSGNNHGVYPVLARSSATWHLPIKQPFWGGVYHAAVTVSYDSNPANTLGITKGATTKTERQNSSSFFTAPTAGGLITELATLALLAVVVYWAVRRLKHRTETRRHWRNYTVMSGDTLQKLAHKHGTTWKRIAQANRLKAPYHLEKGQTIKLPPPSSDKE